MAIEIKNHKNGTKAGVTAEHQLLVRAESHSLQHHTSWSEGQAYQVVATDTGITAKTQTLLHLRNTLTTHNLVISFIRMQAVTNTANKPVIGEYFEMGFDDTISSGGSTITPTNVNRTSGESSSAICTIGDPTMADSMIVTDKWYNESSGEHVHNKEGSHILGLNDTFSVRFTSTGTGEAYARITFMMLAKNRD